MIRLNEMNGGENRNFISYFQSVTTIGVVCQADNPEEAEDKAKEKISQAGVMCGVLTQTPYEIEITEEWSPHPDFGNEFSRTHSNGHITLNEKLKQKIANRLNKTVTELSTDDYNCYIDDLVALAAPVKLELMG